MFSAQDPQLKWPPLFYMFLATLVNIWLSQHHIICSLRSTFGAEGLTCKNIPWDKFIIWRRRSSRNNSTIGGGGGGGGGGSNEQITWCISHVQISSF